VAEDRDVRGPQPSANFTAFNVQNINGVLFVTFANQNTLNGVGGIVDEFKTDGTFIKRLIDDSAGSTAHGHLDLPWGVALAPTGFRQFGGDLLVGNNGGDVWINAFGPNTGMLVGSLTVEGHFIHEGNLWALTFGGGGNGGNPNVLYFTAGVDAGDQGLFGAISAAPSPARCCSSPSAGPSSPPSTSVAARRGSPRPDRPVDRRTPSWFESSEGAPRVHPRPQIINGTRPLFREGSRQCPSDTFSVSWSSR
jgi:hypothetical protein